MSVRLQSLATGLFVGGGAYFYLYKDVRVHIAYQLLVMSLSALSQSRHLNIPLCLSTQIWSCYEGVSQKTSKYHYTINPKVSPVPRRSTHESTSWMIDEPVESRHAMGRTPGEAYNDRVRSIYRMISEKLY
jgi:hypothetical protein